MKKKVPKKLTNQQVKKRIKNLLMDLEPMFDYENFDRYLIFKNEDKDERACEVVSDLEYRRVTIYIYPAFFPHTIRQQRELLLHEFCHTYSDRVYLMAIDLLNDKHVTAEAFRKANEECTSRITNIMDKLLRNRLRYARKAYAKYLDMKK